MHTLVIVGEFKFFYLDWREVSVGEVVVENTVNVVANKSVESGSGVVIEVERQSPPVSCINTIDSATLLHLSYFSCKYCPCGKSREGEGEDT